MTGSDRRLSPRTQVLRPGVLSVPMEEDHHQSVSVTVLDTSEGGCRIRVPMRVENGTPVRLRMEDSGLVLQGVVRYSRQPLQAAEGEYHVGIQYFQPGEPLEDPRSSRSADAAGALLTVGGEREPARGPFAVRIVEADKSKLVVIAPVFVYPDTDLRLDTASTTVSGLARRCGAAIGGYRLTILVSRTAFQWRSLITHPVEAARYAFQSIAAPKSN